MLLSNMANYKLTQWLIVANNTFFSLKISSLYSKVFLLQYFLIWSSIQEEDREWMREKDSAEIHTDFIYYNVNTFEIVL